MKKISLLIITLVLLILPHVSFATCGCVISTRDSIKNGSSSGALVNFSEILHRRYHYYGGGYAGQTVFDLSPSEIRSAYHLISKSLLSEFKAHQHYYREGIELLKTSEVKNSSTYDSVKANLIFRLDKKLQKRHEPYQFQKYLNELGYDCGTPDGIIGGKTRNAVKNFQETYGLSPDGTLGPISKKKMGEVYHNEKRIREINQTNTDTLLLTVERQAGRLSQYIVTNGEGQPLYNGANMLELASRINQLSRIDHTKAIYFDALGVSPKKAEAFERSYRIQQYLQNPNIRVATLSRKFQSLFFSPGVRLLSSPKIEQVKSGIFKGGWRARLDWILNVHKIVMTIHGQTKKVVQNAVQRLSSVRQNLSLAMRMAKVYQELVETRRNIDFFRLTEQSLEFMKKEGIPGDTLAKLGSLKDQTFEGQVFEEKVKKVTGKEFQDFPKNINEKSKLELKLEQILRFLFQFEAERIDLGHLLRKLWIDYDFS